MNKVTPQMRNFAKRIIVHEMGGRKSSLANSSADFPVCEKLRPTLATLMGSAGFRALLSRALALASAEVPKLHAVRVNPSGALEGLEELRSQVDHEAFSGGQIILLAHFLGLLVAFIGESLTVRLVREVWPKLPLNDSNLDTGDTNEKAN